MTTSKPIVHNALKKPAAENRRKLPRRIKAIKPDTEPSTTSPTAMSKIHLLELNAYSLIVRRRGLISLVGGIICRSKSNTAPAASPTIPVTDKNASRRGTAEGSAIMMSTLARHNYELLKKSCGITIFDPQKIGYHVSY